MKRDFLFALWLCGVIVAVPLLLAALPAVGLIHFVLLPLQDKIDGMDCAAFAKQYGG